MLKRHNYSWGRAFFAAFLGAFLGAVWSATIVMGVGIVLFFTYPHELVWHLIAGTILLASLLWMQKIAVRAPENADSAERDNIRTDKTISLFCFAAFYILTGQRL